MSNRLPGNGDIRGQGYDVANSGFGVLPEGADPFYGEGATMRAMNFMEDSVAMGRPFYTQVSYLNVHTPYAAKQETIDKYESLTPGERHNQPLYAAMVEEMDALVGQLLSKLDALNVDDNTYVFFTSDNGGRSRLHVPDGTVNLPLFEGKGTTWEGGLRVPLLVRGPGIEPDTTSDVPVALYDLFPTIADLSNGAATQPDGIDGTSIVPVLENGGDLPEGVDSLQRVNGPNGELFFHYPHYRFPSSAIRDGDFKLVKAYGENGAPDDLFLFDLAASPTESNNPDDVLNLADDLPAITASMLAKLENWLLAVDADLPHDAGGDFNADGSVDVADLNIWQNNFGEFYTAHPDGDSNGDAITDGRDFLRWQNETATWTNQVAQVPEPAPASLALISCLLGSIKRNLRPDP